MHLRFSVVTYILHSQIKLHWCTGSRLSDVQQWPFLKILYLYFRYMFAFRGWLRFVGLLCFRFAVVSFSGCRRTFQAKFRFLMNRFASKLHNENSTMKIQLDPSGQCSCHHRHHRHQRQRQRNLKKHRTKLKSREY